MRRGILTCGVIHFLCTLTAGLPRDYALTGDSGTYLIENEGQKQKVTSGARLGNPLQSATTTKQEKHEFTRRHDHSGGGEC